MDENTQAEEVDELYDLSCRLSKLLEGVANAVRGTPPPLTLWSFHDLPERVAEVVAQRDAAAQGSEDAARWLWWKPWIERRVGDLAPYERERIKASAIHVPSGCNPPLPGCRIGHHLSTCGTPGCGGCAP